MENTKQQTAVEWLEIELKKKGFNFPYVTLKIEQSKEMEKQQKGCSDEELLTFGKSCFYKGFDKAEKDDANRYTAFREEIGNLIEQFKNK